MVGGAHFGPGQYCLRAERKADNGQTFDVAIVKAPLDANELHPSNGQLPMACSFHTFTLHTAL